MNAKDKGLFVRGIEFIKKNNNNKNMKMKDRQKKLFVNVKEYTICPFHNNKQTRAKFQKTVCDLSATKLKKF